jgi:hypothetical protein
MAARRKTKKTVSKRKVKRLNRYLKAGRYLNRKSRLVKAIQKRRGYPKRKKKR